MTPNFKNHMRNSDNFRQAVESPKSWNSMGYICLKTTFLHLKHLQIYLTLLSTDLWFWKMTWGIWQIFSRALKIGILMGSFNPNLKSMTLKSIEDLSVMTMKNYAKFQEDLTCHYKVDMRNLTNFDQSTWKSQKLSF